MIRRALAPLAPLATLALLAGLSPLPAQADGIPVTLTCAGVTGTMRDGNWTYAGAAAEDYRLPYPFGTVVELSDDSRWTIEDTTAPWIGRWWWGAEHLDLYLAVPCDTTPGVWRDTGRTIRLGWGNG